MHEISLCCCVKYFTVLFSCLYWVLGSCVILGSFWVLNGPIFSLIFTQSGKLLYILFYLLLFAGCSILLSASLACYGILKRSKFILGAFVCTLFIIVGSEVATGLWILKNMDRLNDIIRVSIKNSLQEEYGQISTSTVTFDVIQKQFKCCGADGPSDWIASRYNNVGREDIINIAFSSLNMFFNIPESCCNQDLSEITCEIARKHKFDSVFHAGIYEEGCVSKLVRYTSKNSEILIGLIIIAITLEIIAIVLSLYLCCKISKNTNKTKDFLSS